MNRKWRTGLIAGFMLLAAARLLIAWQVPLTDDDAYYWIWSQHLAWGYPDHPPAIALLVKVSTAVFGSSPLGIRLGAVVMTLATGAVVYALGKDLFGPKAGAIAALASQLLPMVAAGGAIAVPDAPFVFFWTLTVWLFWRARTTGARLWWYATGAALGLTVMSKLFGGFLALGLLGFLAASPADRRWFRRPEPYAAAAIAAAIVAPFLWWNVAEGWPSWTKIHHQVPWIRTGGPLDKALAYVVAQFVYYGPLTAPLLVLALGAAIRRPLVSDPRFALLAWAALPILLMPFVLSPGGIPKPHWPAPAYVLAAVMAAGLWWGSEDVRWRRVFAAALGINAILIVIAVFLPLIAPAALDETRGWDQVTTDVEALAARLPQRPGVFIFSTGYQTASQLTYRLRGRYPVTAAATDTQLGRDLPLQQFVGWNAIYVDDNRLPIDIPIDRMFRVLERLPTMTITIDGRVVRRLIVYSGIGFLGSRGR